MVDGGRPFCDDSRRSVGIWELGGRKIRGSIVVVKDSSHACSGCGPSENGFGELG